MPMHAFLLSSQPMLWVRERSDLGYSFLKFFRTAIARRAQTLGSSTHWIFAAAARPTFFPKMVSAFPPGYVFLFFAAMMVLQLIWVTVMGSRDQERTARADSKTFGYPVGSVQRLHFYDRCSVIVAHPERNRCSGIVYENPADIRGPW